MVFFCLLLPRAAEILKTSRPHLLRLPWHAHPAGNHKTRHCNRCRLQLQLRRGTATRPSGIICGCRVAALVFVVCCASLGRETGNWKIGNMFLQRRHRQPVTSPSPSPSPSCHLPSPVAAAATALIGLLHRRRRHSATFLCHAAWATRTAIALLVLLAVATASTTTRAAALSTDAPSGMRIQTLLVNCTRELLDMQLHLSQNFRGLLYAKDFTLECRSRGQNAAHIQLRVPTSGCGVRAEPLPDGGMEYTVRVMLQMEQKLRQSSDILRTVRCQLPAKAMGMTLPPLSGRDR